MSEDWTKENLRKLFAALKKSIPKDSSRIVYSQVLRHVDWKNVAFPPFSPEACQKKWTEVLHKLRKTRTLTELIDEAELNLSGHDDTVDAAKQPAAEGLLPKPPVNAYQLFCKEQVSFMAGVPNREYVSVWAQRWQDLPESQKTEYSMRCRKLKRQYAAQINECFKNLDEGEQQQILSKNGLKRSKLQKSHSKLKKAFPGEPKIPARSSHILFCKDQMELLKEKFPNAKERLEKVNQMWKDLSIQDKQSYSHQLSENFRKYSLELQEWFKKLTAAEQEDYLKHNPSKCQYLDAKIPKKRNKREEHCSYRPSDSEDEELSSSEEEGNQLDYDEEDETGEEEGEDIAFEMY